MMFAMLSQSDLDVTNLVSWMLQNLCSWHFIGYGLWGVWKYNQLFPVIAQFFEGFVHLLSLFVIQAINGNQTEVDLSFREWLQQNSFVFGNCHDIIKQASLFEFLFTVVDEQFVNKCKQFISSIEN